MRLVHTLLFMLRREQEAQDRQLATECLRSLEASRYKTLVVYNQGDWSREEMEAFLSQFSLQCYIIGEGKNVGTVVGRQSCFEYIWEHWPQTEYISELHLDMLFAQDWEEPLIRYLAENDEPLVGCGIVDKDGKIPFLDRQVNLPGSTDEYPAFLAGLRTNTVVHGFTNPCIHVSSILQQTGGYHAKFLHGTQCFEDDSMLLGYYYYYGTRRDWKPRVNFNSMVYHAVAGQRLSTQGNVMINYAGLVRQYGAMGLKALSELHANAWHKNFFKGQYDLMQ